MSEILVFAINPIVATVFNTVCVVAFLRVWVYDLLEVLWFEIVSWIFSPKFTSSSLLLFEPVLF